MATKNNPGDYDCYANAKPDEPMFVLLGRDPVAGLCVRTWVAARAAMGNKADVAKLREALDVGQQMQNWATGLDKDVAGAVEAMRSVAADDGLRSLLARGRAIWGKDKLTLPQIVVRLGVTLGDLAVVARNFEKDAKTPQQELQRAMGNVIFSFIRWCDDLGLDPVLCVARAVSAQEQFAWDNRRR